MVSEEFETKFVAAVFMGRGLVGTYFFMSNSVGGFSTLSYGSGLMSFLVAFLAIASTVTFITYGLTNKRYWSWMLATPTVLIYLTTDITLTVLGRPQPVLEFGVDSFLVLYFMQRRKLFVPGNPQQERFDRATGKSD